MFLPPSAGRLTRAFRLRARVCLVSTYFHLANQLTVRLKIPCIYIWLFPLFHLVLLIHVHARILQRPFSIHFITATIEPCILYLDPSYSSSTTCKLGVSLQGVSLTLELVFPFTQLVEASFGQHLTPILASTSPISKPQEPTLSIPRSICPSTF